MISVLILLALKLSSLPEARQVADSWAYPESGTLWFLGGLAVELMLLVARFILGYFVYIGRHASPWVFYPLVVLVAVSGFSGLALSVAALALRLWQGAHCAVKT
ncbi:hypothetical protein [Simiduia aestuariiviva]|uniref:Uncharacterized protein n=1 Tax=Simiduia aestuariiviva TaxID=1510459 RepID=A0A839UPR2_9GAMM|nr:hypothetical protein [Simiduia aestuariiviva]MBB3170214.1 hypothetical protein [Simiduia aestuariiviva]